MHFHGPGLHYLQGPLVRDHGAPEVTVDRFCAGVLPVHYVQVADVSVRHADGNEHALLVAKDRLGGEVDLSGFLDDGLLLDLLGLLDGHHYVVCAGVHARQLAIRVVPSVFVEVGVHGLDRIADQLPGLQERKNGLALLGLRFASHCDEEFVVHCAHTQPYLTPQQLQAELVDHERAVAVGFFVAGGPVHNVFGLFALYERLLEVVLLLKQPSERLVIAVEVGVVILAQRGLLHRDALQALGDLAAVVLRQLHEGTWLDAEARRFKRLSLLAVFHADGHRGRCRLLVNVFARFGRECSGGCELGLPGPVQIVLGRLDGLDNPPRALLDHDPKVLELAVRLVEPEEIAENGERGAEILEHIVAAAFSRREVLLEYHGLAVIFQGDRRVLHPAIPHGRPEDLVVDLLLRLRVLLVMQRLGVHYRHRVLAENNASIEVVAPPDRRPC